MTFARITTRLVLLSLAFLLPLSAPAADAPPPVSEMWTMVPKADHRDAFFEAFKEHLAVRAEAGDPWVWKTYTPVLGDSIDMVAVRYCCFEWADLDSYREWSESNPSVEKHWHDKVDPHVASYGHYFDQVSWVNSNIERGWGPYRYFAVTEFSPKAGMAGEFDAARDEIAQIALNQGWANETRPWMWSSAIGGEPSESLVIPLEKYADFRRDQQSFFNFLSGVMGSDEAADQLLNRFNGTVANRQVQIWELHEDLSMQTPD